jgi:hypothetical protein
VANKLKRAGSYWLEKDPNKKFQLLAEGKLDKIGAGLNILLKSPSVALYRRLRVQNCQRKEKILSSPRM